MSSQPRRRRLEVEDIGDLTVVYFTDKEILDEQNIQIVGEQLFSLVDELGRRKLVLDFGNVECLNSPLVLQNRPGWAEVELDNVQIVGLHAPQALVHGVDDTLPAVVVQPG